MVTKELPLFTDVFHLVLLYVWMILKEVIVFAFSFQKEQEASHVYNIEIFRCLVEWSVLLNDDDETIYLDVEKMIGCKIIA